MNVHARTREFALLFRGEIVIVALMVNDELYRGGKIPITPRPW